MSALLTLIKCLPELLALIKSVQVVVDNVEQEKTVADHLALVTKAFNEKNSTLLNDAFNK